MDFTTRKDTFSTTIRSFCTGIPIAMLGQKFPFYLGPNMSNILLCGKNIHFKFLNKPSAIPQIRKFPFCLIQFTVQSPCLHDDYIRGSLAHLFRPGTLTLHPDWTIAHNLGTALGILSTEVGSTLVLPALLVQNKVQIT